MGLLHTAARAAPPLRLRTSSDTAGIECEEHSCKTGPRVFATLAPIV